MALKPQVMIFPDLPALQLAAARQFTDLIQQATARHGRFSAVLSGGSTPTGLYQLLAQPSIAEKIPWQQVHFFWGDERCVPPDDPESNYGAARTDLLQHIPVPAENIHRVHGELSPAEAADDYTRQLQEFARADGDLWPHFDVVLLGLGEDGHTASLFPGQLEIESVDKAVLAVTANYQGRPAQRITLTPLVFNLAAHVYFLASGEGKAGAVAGSLMPSGDPQHWPARRIQPEHGAIVWMIDHPASKLLPDDMIDSQYLS